MFKKILIANRGEIACRIARTAKTMGIATVAVYSEADANALHVKVCDEAVFIGPAPAVESYLSSEKILFAAQQTGSQAIHPGYGFLSENTEFSEKCESRNITFIGPSSDSILKMGSKSAARQAVSAAGVPVLPGYDGDRQDSSFLLEEARQIGYPLLIKAVSGGGGKGMRAIDSESHFTSALDSVKRESLSAFADDRVLLERYLPVARHIEIQIFADTHGNVVHLFERDCSMQRRHQKVLEEAPAPLMKSDIRDKMAQAAMECARAISYVGAGTIEFLLAPDDTFYFMEMNTRLQVEHPVTELISGQDLVEWQIRVADRELLPCQQTDLRIKGHAIEARIYAENPQQGFLPAIGRLHLLDPPDTNEYTRVDTGVLQGDEISIHYDPMIAKLIVWGESRPIALQRMRQALSHYHLLGIHHNIDFLSQLVTHPQIEEGKTDTRFIEHHLSALLGPNKSLPDEVLISACCYDLLTFFQQSVIKQKNTSDPWSPWATSGHWQHGLRGNDLLCYKNGEDLLTVAATINHDLINLIIFGKTLAVKATLNEDQGILIEYENQRLSAKVIETKNELHILYENKDWRLERFDKRYQENSLEEQTGSLTAPMPGSVIDVMVTEDKVVQIGDALMVIEAMKMEHHINSPQSGIVKSIHFETGDQVNEGDVLLIIE